MRTTAPNPAKFTHHRQPLAFGPWRSIAPVDVFVIVLGLLVLLGATGRTGLISGRIVDAKTNKPLGYANIVLVGTSRGAMTLEDGTFEIPGVPIGTYTIKAMMMGYQSIEDTVVVLPDTLSYVAFTMSEGAIAETQVIEILGKRKRVDVTSSDIATRTGDELHARGGRGTEVQRPGEAISKIALRSGVAPGAQDLTVRGSTYRPPPRTPGTEQYDVIDENVFLTVLDHPMSTFSIDVDAAAYANVRRFIRAGRLPPHDAVRIEEMINYFDYDYPGPSDGRPFSIASEVAACPWDEKNKLVLIGLQGRRVPLDDLPPANLVFLLDVSGSMQPPNKLPLLKQAFRILAANLRAEDRVAIVTYSSNTRLVLNSTPGDRGDRIIDAIDNLGACGCTNGAGGLELAYSVAQEHFIEEGNNRVVLATDGDFNVGVSDDAGLVRLIEAKRRSGVFLSVLTFGEGNLKDSKMEKLADKGNGNYHYIDDILEARRVLIEQMGGTLLTLAKDVKIQIEFNPARVGSYRLIGYENRRLENEDFDDDTKDAGEIGAGHSVTALYEVTPVDRERMTERQSRYQYFAVHIDPAAFETEELLTVRFRYKDPDADESHLIEQAVYDGDGTFDEASPDFRFAAAVAEFGLLLRASEHRGEASWRHAMHAGRAALAQDPDGYRAEFVRLVAAAHDLDGGGR